MSLSVSVSGPAGSERNVQVHECTSARGPPQLEGAADQRGAFAHGDQPESTTCALGRQSTSMILNLEIERAALRVETHGRLVDAGMPRHVAQRLLQNAVDVNGRGGINRRQRIRSFIAHADSELS